MTISEISTEAAETAPEGHGEPQTLEPEGVQPEDAPEPGEGDTDGDENTDIGNSDDDGNVSRREAKYRRELRASQAEVASLTARLTAMQTAEAERVAATVLSDGGDLWRDGAELSALLDDDGHLDRAAVTKVARELAKAHPHWKAPTRRPVTTDGMRSGATGQEIGTTKPTWRDALAETE